MDEEKFMLRIIEALTEIILKLENRIMSALDDLAAAVALENTTVASAITLLNGLKVALDAAIASGNPGALKALSDNIGAQTQALAAAVVTDTPAPSPPPPPPPAPSSKA
jgi:hypothetical protein